jgi:hypothetical protein
VAPSIHKKLALTSLTSGGRSVGIVRVRTEATELFIVDVTSVLVAPRRTIAILFSLHVFVRVIVTLNCYSMFEGQCKGQSEWGGGMALML